MSDWPVVARFHKPVISTFSPEAQGSSFSAQASAAPASAVWPSAALAIHVPFVISAPYLVRTVWWANGATVANGTAACGVYARTGALLLSCAATATSGASAAQKVALGAAVLLYPGSYYMALALSSASDTILRMAPSAAKLQSMGLAQQAAASTLPDPFTQAAITQTYFPLFGIANATVI